MEIAYNPISTSEEDIEQNGSVHHQHDGHSTLRYQTAMPISRAPTNPRDLEWWIMYQVWFLFVMLMGLIKHSGFLRDSFVLYNEAGGWTSMLMVSTLFGTVIGLSLTFALNYNPVLEILLRLYILNAG